ncbi:MAG: heme exporter protein CcmB [Coriobacteriales bacterium]|jgi:heme exporter protein B|nr:heme exporter protein CcmB [Coriobacteriales bacterium]
MTNRPSAIRQFAVLFVKDLRQESHTRDMLTSMGLYSLLVLVIFGAALSQSTIKSNIIQISGGLVWAMLVFTSLLGLNRSFAAEKEDAGLDGILLIPLDRSVIYLAKTASNLVFLLIVEVLACPLFYFFFLADYPLTTSLWLVVPPLFFVSLGIAGVGTLLATITSGTRGKDVLLAILFIPVIFPLLFAVVSATSVAVMGSEQLLSVYVPALALAAGYDVIMISLSWLLYGFVVTN